MDKGANSLWGLSAWQSNNWNGWDLGHFPPELNTEAEALIGLLQGKSPIKEEIKDRRGWGNNSGNYSTSKGYKHIQAIPYAAPNPVAWNFIWSKTFIPKIDIFCWSLAHKSILTGDNLKKRGMEGPTRCPLCKCKEETMDHIMLDCHFSKEVWLKAMNLNLGINLPHTILDLFSNWMNLSPFHLTKKTMLQTAWNWLPKSLCWKIWTERNNRIFRDQDSQPSKIAVQARAILGEALDSNLSLKNSTNLLPKELHWLSMIVSNLQNRNLTNHPQTAQWEIRLDEPDFMRWKSTLNEPCLFFDGASKGNPGIAGGGGMIL